MSGLKADTNDLLFNGITLKVCIEKGYTVNDFHIVKQLHNKLVRKYHSLNKDQRAMLRAKARGYLNERIANLSKPNESNDSSTEADNTDQG